MTTKFAVNDQLGITDINGLYRRAVVSAIVTYPIAKQLANLEVLAQSYPSPNDTVDHDGLFYVLSSLPGDSPEFTNVVLWDSIIDMDNTSYITKKAVWRIDILPIPAQVGVPIRSMDEIVNDIKTAIADKVQDAVINYEDITDAEDDVLGMMKKATDLALETLDEFKALETVRPLIAQLSSVDFNKLTSDISNYLTNIQARLSALDNGSV